MDATYDLGFVRCLYGFLIGHLTYRLWQAVSGVSFSNGLLEGGALIGIIAFVSLVGHSGYSFLAPLVFAAVVFVFAFETGPIARLMLNRGNEWLGRISYSIYMWQAFIIVNLVYRPVSIIEKMTGRVLTTTEGVSSALGGESAKLILLEGRFLPILATLLFVGLLLAVASVSYYLIERPGQELFARLASRIRRRSMVLTSLRQPPHRHGRDCAAPPHQEN
jgi:peptidoglycan/LPS O-acetylase OafA/YrhL